MVEETETEETRFLCRIVVIGDIPIGGGIHGYAYVLGSLF